MVRPVTYSGHGSHSASTSIASASSVGSVFFLPQYMHVTDPSYISLEAANAIVASYPPPETTRNVISDDTSVNPEGLRTVNMFLDYILHEFLARAKATSLLRLREAVALVIRTTLGTAAMVEAEQELAAYLHDSDAELYGHGDESDDDNDNGDSTWNLEKVWARARTKCMIYSTLGDKEEDDFEEESEEDADYDLPASKRKLSPAGAIYLTAVLEFIGEHCFLVSARTAFHRLGSSLRANDPHTQPVPLVVEDADVKRGIAEDDLTTRIWRKWKRSEKLLTTLSEHTHRRHTEPRRTIDSRTGSETLTRLPFTPAQASKQLGPVDPRRSSIVSAPDIDTTREEISHGVDSRTMSLPPSPPGKSSFAGKHKRHHHRGTSDSGTVRQSESVTNIKETLGERGVMLPDSPRSSRANPFDEMAVNGIASAESRPLRPVVLSQDSTDNILQAVFVRGKEISQAPRENHLETEYQDALATPPLDHMKAVEDTEVPDPMRTPTPGHATKFSSTEPHQPSMPSESEEDVVVMGGDGGLDYSVWETRTPTDQRFYFSVPTPKGSAAPSEASYQILNAPTEDGSRPPSSHRPSTRTTDRMSEVDKADSASVEQTVRQTLNEDLAPIPPVVVTKPSVTSQETSEALPGSWPNEEKSISQVNSLAVEAEESDGASAHSNHVNDQILSHFRELEREKQAAATKVLGLDEYDSNETSHLAPTDLYQGQGPMIINHTELTPIMESSPRESLASEPASPIASPRLVSMKSRSSDERSPPGTRHSSHSGKGAGSTGSIVLSTDGANERARSSSLTSQAERLRSKFMNRNGKSSPDKELTVDTVAADPAKMERRMKFESLIRSGETMKLSLTPTTLRTIESDNITGEHVEREHRTVPARVRQQAQENSTRELSDFLRSTGPESFLGGTTYERRGSLPTDQLNPSPPQQTIRSMPSTPVVRNGKTIEKPPVPSPKFVPRSPVRIDPEESTLQLAAFIRTTGPGAPAAPPIALGGRNVAEKVVANSVHSNGDSSTAGLLRYQSVNSQRYPPSPSTSTAYGTMLEDDDSDDPELAMYPGARRKQKTLPQEESLADFLRNTGPPEPSLPPSPTTPKALRDRFGNNNKTRSRANMKSPEPGQPKAVDIFEAARIAPPRVMSPTPSVRTNGTAKGNYQVGGQISPPLSTTHHYKGLNVTLPNSSLMGDDYFSTRGPRSTISRQSSLMRDPDEIQTIRRTPSRVLANGTGPREPVVPRSHTTDSLADFLKNTGPADFGAPAPKAIKKSKSGFFRRLLGGGEKQTKVHRSESMSGRFTPITIPANVRG